MANPKRTILGVEIGAREVRMVEMRGGSPLPQILKAGSVPLPAGAVDGDRIAQVEVVADLISGLHSRLGCQSRSAIFGMGIQSVVTRILAIPRVPESELRTVLEGELAHYQILRAGTGAFDYFRLELASTNADASSSVLLMAVEERIAQGYRRVAEKAGLQLLALEPITLSLFRAAYFHLEREPAALCLAVTPQRSELSILDHGQLRLYRRLETGSNDFLTGRKTEDAPTPRAVNLAAEPPGELNRPTRTLLTMDDASVPTGSSSVPPNVGLGGTENAPPLGIGNYGDIVPQAAAAFSNEVQKTLDYYRREFPNSTAIGRIILSTNDPEAEGLSEWLSQSLRMDVRIADNPTTPNLPPTILSQLEAPQGLRFLGASGLALHGLTPEWKQVPRFNLSTTGQAATAVPVDRDRVTLMMIASVGILFGGLLFGYYFNRESDNQQHILETMRRNLGVKREDVRTTQDQVVSEQQLNGIVKTDNLPVPRLLDTIASALPPDVGLNNVTIDRKGKIIVEGKARSNERFYDFFYQLTNRCPDLVTPHLLSLSTDETSNIVHFRMETGLKGTQSEQDMKGSSAP